MRRVIETIKRVLRRAAPANAGRLAPRDAAAVVRHVAATYEVEYSCDEAYRLFDEYAEAVIRGDDVAQLMPLVQRHIDMCPDCREELEALLRVLKSSNP